MADDNRSRGYRTGDPYGHPRPQAPAQPSGDPLAELARLIGQQNESMPSYDRNEPQWAPSDQRMEPPQDWHAPDPFAQRDPYRAQQDPRSAHDRSGYPDVQQPPHYGDGYVDPRYADPQYGNGQYHDQGDARYSEQQNYQDQQYADPRYAQQQAAEGYPEPRSGYQPDYSQADPNFPGAPYRA